MPLTVRFILARDAGAHTAQANSRTWGWPGIMLKSMIDSRSALT